MFDSDALYRAYYLETLRRPPADLDAQAWVTEQFRRLAETARRQQRNTLAEMNMGFMEGWSPNDILNDVAEARERLEACCHYLVGEQTQKPFCKAHRAQGRAGLASELYLPSAGPCAWCVAEPELRT